MAEEPGYKEWRRTWPEVIVHTQTETAVDYLRRYYSTRDDGRPRYSGSRFESVAALNTDPNTLGLADFVAVSMLSVDIPAQAAIRMLERDTSLISELLSDIKDDVDIVDADPSLLAGDSPAVQLWRALREPRDGLGPTKTSKLLAAKRPRLLPIWDKFVHKATGLDTKDYWRKFQYVLADDQRRVWNWLGELRKHTTEIPPEICELRILDVLLWMTVEVGHR